MIIKKIGSLLLIKLKLFKIIAILTPLAMVASLFLIFFNLHLKEGYEFQQPSLRTKIEDIKLHKASLELSYTPVIEGIKFIKIAGAMDHECILVTFPSKYENSSEVKHIFETLNKSDYNPKSTILLSYSDVNRFGQFFDWYHDPHQNYKFSLGIIRIGINIQIENHTSLAKGDRKQANNKAFFNIYSTTMHPDVDYFQAVKQLLQVTLISWLPCQDILKQPLRSLKYMFIKVGQFLNVKHQTKGLAEHIFCQFNNHLRYKASAHEIMMNNGFQGASIRFMLAIDNQKAQQVVVSFVKEFMLQEEHLHSARTFFYPMSRNQQLPILGFMISSIVFTTSVVIYLIDRYIKKYQSIEARIPYRFVALLYFWVIQFKWTVNITYTLLAAITLFLASILTDLRTFIANQRQSSSQTYLEYILVPTTALVSIYFSLQCYALSILTIFATCLIIAKPCRPILRCTYKTLLTLIFLYGLSQLNTNSHLSPSFLLSLELKTTLLLLLMGLSL